MKITLSSLREWVNPALDADALCHRLTMGGLEVEGVVDDILDVSITPNRGDCLSVKGLARDIAALTETAFTPLAIPTVSPTANTTFPVHVTAAKACPRYIGRVIRNLDAKATTPNWIQTRLTSAGMKLIHPLVDVTNYVMLELGQPMHAFDLATLHDHLEIRQARAGESLVLLDNTEKNLDAETLVIADQKGPLAIAGVMGGLASAVTAETTALFLESAYFTPTLIARQREHYQLLSDSAYRFERGVDPTLQRDAIERATALIAEIAGGEIGPIIEICDDKERPHAKTITLPHAKIKQVLGIDLPVERVAAIFDRLQFTYHKTVDAWEVTPPLYRFDMHLPEDLIEELARLQGYEHIPARAIRAVLQQPLTSDASGCDDNWRAMWRDLGYNEVVTYSFIDQALSEALDPQHQPLPLVNPMTANMNVMRTSLWPGLIQTAQYNLSRQQERLRLFEIGTCFIANEEKLYLSGLLTGPAAPEQWGVKAREADFFDLKGDLEAFFALINQKNMFEVTSHPALHPGQTAHMMAEGKVLGLVGALHPHLCQQYDLPKSTFLFELDVSQLHATHLPMQAVPAFPSIRRDIAILVKQTIPVKAISDTIKSVAGPWLKSLFIFDVYQGKGIAANEKSIAAALIWQHPTRTLVEEEVAALMAAIVDALNSTYGAQLRSGHDSNVNKGGSR